MYFMAAKSKLLVFIVCSFVLTIGNTAEQAKHAEIVKTAKEQYQMIYQGYVSKLGYCEGQASTNEITDENKKILLSLDLTLAQLKKALFVLEMKMQDDCAKDNLGWLLIVREKYIETLKTYKLKDDNIDMALTPSADIYYDVLVDYLALSSEITAEIRNIKQLNKPFSSSYMMWKKN